MSKIRINPNLCKKCGRCVDICPEGLFMQSSPLSLPRIPRQKSCISCGHCVSICPSGAVSHIDFPEQDQHTPTN